MERRRLGKTDMDVSVLGFGGAEVGFAGLAADAVAKVLNGALDAGLNVIDTAECYGTSEELLGAAVSHRRKDFWLFTKVGHPEGYGAPEDWSKDGILRSVERSLKRLRTDHVDLVQLHSCDETHLRKGEVIEAVETARQRGLARWVGYSGDATAARYALECGRFDVLQTSVSIADQESLDLLLPLAREMDVGVIAKRPIANAAWRTGQKPESAYHHAYWDRLQKLDYPFLKGDVAASIATALRFTLYTPGVHTAIVGTTKPGRWQENAAIAALGPLPGPEVQKLRARWREVAPATWHGQV